MEHPTNPLNYVLPQDIDFATDVKTDRLAILWKVTIVVSLTIVFTVVGILTALRVSPLAWVIAPLVVTGACLLTRNLLKRNHFHAAVWVYTFGLMSGLTIAMFSNDLILWQILPYAYILVVFIVGLLVHPINTFGLAVVASIITLAVPIIGGDGVDEITMHQGFAIVLMFVSAGLASQVTGELYAVTEWALMNYQRERRTNVDLFESRNELHRALNRSEALSDKLQEINEELAVAHEAAEAAKNFRGQFLANMSHELRTPLNAIIGFSETMLKFPMMYNDEPLPQTYNKDMGQIYSSGRQLLDLINDILDLARVDAGKLEIYMERVALRKPIDDVLAMAKGLLQHKDVSLESILPEKLPFVWADETRVRQVLVNLYSNACKFTEKGKVTLTVREADDGIQFSVKDTGSGIEPTEMEKIFEEFQQVENRGRDPRSGSGLGLAISRQLIQLMGGRIWAESTLGEGSTFHFLLQPYHKDEMATIETPVIERSASTETN